MNIPDTFTIVSALSAEHVRAVHALFLEYAGWLGVDLSFQDFDRELADLPGEYGPPKGSLLLAMIADRFAGCVALRPIGDEICEMKRLFVRPDFRGLCMGRRLACSIITAARTLGYHRMRLDTLATMTQAIALYQSLGFESIPPYRFNPLPGATYMELRLSDHHQA